MLVSIVNLVNRVNTLEGNDLVTIIPIEEGYLVRENRRDIQPLMSILETEVKVLKYLLKLEERQKVRLKKEGRYD